MPRIAVTLATVVLLAGSIGLNIVRYPVVWEMVADLPHTASPGLSIPTAPAASPAKIALTDAEAKRPNADATPQPMASFEDSDHPQASSPSKATSPHAKPNAAQSKSTAADRPKQPGDSAVQHDRDKDKDRKSAAATATAQSAAKSKKRKDTPRPSDNQWTAEVSDARKAEVADASKPTVDATFAQPADPIAADRPLVPVIDSGAASGSTAANELQPALRRLPPVVAAPAGTTTFVVPASYSRSLPEYPSTGL